MIINILQQCMNNLPALFIPFLIINNISCLLKFIIYRTITLFINNLDINCYIFIQQLIYYFATLLTIHIIYYITNRYLEDIIIKKIRDIFKQLISTLLCYRIEYFRKNNSNKFNQLWEYLSNIEIIIEKIILEVPKIITFLCYFVYTIYNFSGIALILLSICNILMMFFMYLISKKQFDIQENCVDLDLLTKNKFNEIVSNIEHVKLCNTTEQEINKIIDLYDDCLNIKRKDKTITTLLSFSSDQFNDILIFMINTLAIGYILNGVITPVELMYLVVTTTNCYYQLIQLKDIYCHCSKITYKLNNIHNILFKDEKESTTLIDSNLTNNFKGIIFDRVTFGYSTDKYILKNISFKFLSDKINILLGPNGSGKSTIVKLLLRLYELNKDNIIDGNIIYYNGLDISKISLQKLRSNITFVSLEPQIFDGTIWNNIIYGTNYKTEKQIYDMCDILDLKDWVLDNRNRKCGFRGKHLSGGDRKKIQLLNAICKNTDVIIFDEPSNALDSNGIKWFINFVIKLKDEYKKTIIIITHDVRLLEVADYITDLTHLSH